MTKQDKAAFNTTTALAAGRKLSKTTADAIRRYGFNTCIEARLSCDVAGNGASTVAIELGLDRTSSADAAINAGREIMTGSRI